MINRLNSNVGREPDGRVGEEFIVVRVYVEFPDRVINRRFHSVWVEGSEVDNCEK